MSSCCIVCNKPFVEGDYLQGFLKSPDDPKGSWTKPGLVDEDYQKRCSLDPTNSMKKKHKECEYVN